MPQAYDSPDRSLESAAIPIAMGRRRVVRTNIDIDDDLLAEAMRLAGTKTKKSTVEAGLAELIRRHRTRRVIELRGAVEWVGELDDLRGGRADAA
jgi:Arc/MetJ family transcription regulator